MDLDPIWVEHQDKLLFFIKGKVGNECDAKDLLQQVYVKVAQKSASLRNRAKLLNWIYQVTRNTIVDYYRAKKKNVDLPEELPAPKKEANNWALISRCVRPFIEELPPTYRDVLLLSEIEGLDQKQVAKKLGISLASAKSRILRGKLKLKKKFDDCCIFECGPQGAQIHSDTFAREDRE